MSTLATRCNWLETKRNRGELYFKNHARCTTLVLSTLLYFVPCHTGFVTFKLAERPRKKWASCNGKRAFWSGVPLTDSAFWEKLGRIRFDSLLYNAPQKLEIVEG